MTNQEQAHPPTVDEQLQDARTASAGELGAQVSRMRAGLTDALAYEIEHNGYLGEQQNRLRVALGLPPVDPPPITEAFAALRAVAGSYFDDVDVDAFMQETRGEDPPSIVHAAERAERASYAALRTAAQTVIDSAARELNYSEDVRLVSTAALRALERCVSSNGAEPTITPLEETQAVAMGVCPRCGRPLNNVSPGISVITGGVSICTSCLNPGETEVARARSLAPQEGAT